MREELQWTVDTPDGARIYGCTDKAAKPSGKCVVMVHGLTGHMNEYHMKVPARFFAEHGYDVIRFNLYFGSCPHSRRLRECSIGLHAQDLNTVLATKAQSYDHIFLIGHSYGGPTVMQAQPEKATAVSLWDPSFDLPRLWNGSQRRKLRIEKGFNILDWGVEFLMGEEMFRESFHHYDADECLALSQSFGRPIQVIHAGEDVYADASLSWHDRGHVDNERHIVPGADHCFFRGDTLETVMDLSLAWFDKYS